jgi:hypothetical protein
VLYDLAHAQLDTMLTNIMSSTTIQAAGPVRYLKPPIVLAATVEGETLYAYVKH